MASLKIRPYGVSTENTTIIEDGEIIDQRIDTLQQVYVSGASDFIMVYQPFISYLQTVGSLDIKLYFYIVKSYGFDIEFQIGAALKKRIAELFKCKPTSISNSLSNLKKDGLIYSTATGIYRLNPEFTFKGSSNQRKKAYKELMQNMY
jgi:predicted transcriptional regulator